MWDMGRRETVTMIDGLIGRILSKKMETIDGRKSEERIRVGMGTDSEKLFTEQKKAGRVTPGLHFTFTRLLLARHVVWRVWRASLFTIYY